MRKTDPELGQEGQEVVVAQRQDLAILAADPEHPQARTHQDRAHLVEIARDTHQDGAGQDSPQARKRRAMPTSRRSQQSKGEECEKEWGDVGGEIDEVGAPRVEPGQASRIFPVGADKGEELFQEMTAVESLNPELLHLPAGSQATISVQQLVKRHIDKPTSERDHGETNERE